jgi:hypothetical protein
MGSRLLGDCFGSLTGGCSRPMQPVLISAGFGLGDTAPKVARFKMCSRISLDLSICSSFLPTPTEK